ncbi:hypothetical protein FACS1894147_05510 [Spirochaetia bacterium]|nr:hypothetical protein FACS1894147_05510 [Spirochaetia bacterium]
MADDTINAEDSQNIAWHPAFFEAIQLELADYKDVLQFISEYQLTTEPLRIDVLIIKKPPDVVIEKNIAAIFRAVNIVEYKSPGDYVSVDDFYKVYGYACLYASLNKAAITDLTLTFVESRYPRELLAHLRDVRGYEVAENQPGIYTVIGPAVRGDILPVQVIDSRKLSAEENIWLKDLSNKLDVPEIRRIAEAIQRQGKAARAYLDAIFRANLATMEEAYKMSDTTLTMERVLENIGLTAKWEARGELRGEAIGEARGEEKKALEIARNLLGNGFSPEQTAQLAGLDAGKVRALLN